MSCCRLCFLFHSPFLIRHGGFLKEGSKGHSDLIRRPFQILPYQFPPTLHRYSRHFRRVLLPLLLFLSQSGSSWFTFLPRVLFQSIPFRHLDEYNELRNQICADFLQVHSDQIGDEEIKTKNIGEFSLE